MTYLAENLLSYLNGLGFPGLAEVQIGWITELNTMLVTENNVAEFNTKIAGKTSADLLKILKTKGTSKLKTQGTKEYFQHRTGRHDDKLQELLDPPSVRYGDWVKLDPHVAPLIAFLTGKCEGIYVLQAQSNLADIANKIVHYDSAFGFKSGPTKHAELYHLEVFEAVANAMKLGVATPHYYVAGTKRACSTCAGALEEYSKKPVLANLLHADYQHPGNLWTAQDVNQSDHAVANTLRNLNAADIYVTSYNKKRKRGAPVAHVTSGFNSDSDSDNEYD